MPGGTWEQAQMRARSLDATARPYMSADIPMTAVEDFRTPQGQVLLEKGKRQSNRRF